MFGWIAHWIASLGAFGIGALMLLENLILLLPSELIMPFGGFLSSRGNLSFWAVLAAGFAGSMLGALPWYFAARIVGRERTTRWITRNGSWIGIRPRDLDRADRWFDRHARGAVFLARITPGVRPLIGLPAGFARMPLLPFLGWTALGTALWVTGLAWAGRLLGRHWKSIAHVAGPIGWAIAGLLALAAVWLIVRARRDRTRHHRR